MRRKGQPLAPILALHSFVLAWFAAFMGGVDPKLRIRFPPRHFPDCRDRQGMGVPYSVTVFIRESRPKIKAKAESKMHAEKNANNRMERAGKAVEIAMRIAN